ncbi:MAG: ribosome maturation factor RimM [Cyanobacteria bacterium CRU_2_1]|nr:ribosome maturation factor RimM [Cyanobacteria bacterium RU_5_0]NJR60349.1 ribosome maturation factor RimM [Cyanobacteria bacterium CRU_2_1]
MWLEVGKIVAAQGLKGEVRVYSDSDFPERLLEPGQRWLLRPGAEEPESIELLSGRFLTGKKLYVIRLAGITDRTQAESLRDCRLLVPESDRPSLEEDEFHVLDLIGLEVFDQATQKRVGVVVNVISAGNDLLEVERPFEGAEPASSQSPHPRSTVLIPFVKAIVPIVDLEQQRIEITPPAGLIE